MRLSRLISDHTLMNAVALFLKAPVLGTVKTRLAKSLGEASALLAYRRMVEFLLGRIGKKASIHIHYAAENLEPMVAWLGKDYRFIAQLGDGLGARLTNGMETEFASGAHKLIFLGGDCPFVDQEIIEESFIALDRNEVVIGPAVDGGYYLIGMKQNRAELFEGIHWGSETVFADTVEICRSKGLSHAILPEISDVDDMESWEKAERFMNRYC